MAINSNRYPRAGAVARDYRRPRTDPTRRYPTPDNDNNPNRPRPRPKPWIPDNDNRPVPKPTDWSLSEPPRVPGYYKWLRRFARLHPLLPLGLGVWQWYQSDPRFNPGDYGFTLVCQIPGPYTHLCYAAGFAANNCGTSNQPVCSTTEDDFTIPPRSNSTPNTVRRDVIRYMFETSPARGTIMQEWKREIRYGQGYPGYEPDGRPKWYPDADPWPEPWPRQPRRPLPWDDPFIEPGRPVPKTPRNPRPEPKYPRRPRLPEDKVDLEPPSLPEFRPKPEPPPLPRQPRKRERERKIRIEDLPNRKLRRILGWMLSAASESGDFLESLYDALPDELQHQDDNMAQKFDKVFKNLDKVDFGEAVNNLWTNYVEDRYFGKGFGDMADALEEFGIELPTLKL